MTLSNQTSHCICKCSRMYIDISIRGDYVNQEGTHLQYVRNQYARFEYKGMKTFGVTPGISMQGLNI